MSSTNRHARALLAVALLLAVGGTAASVATGFLGRPLSECFEILRERGLNVLFSTAVVDPGLVATVEPSATEPRAILAELLAPHGLEIREGAGGAVIVVRGAGGSAGTLRGRVLSAERRRPVIGATVTLVGVAATGLTRPDGSYEIARVPAGTYTVRFTATGFIEQIREGVALAPGSATEVSAVLNPQPRFVEEILVTPSRHAVVTEEQDSARTVERSDHVLIPAFGGDVSRVVESLPGIAAADNSAAFNVRGATTRDVSMVLDGLEVYQPFHLPGLRSPYSFIDSDLVDTLDVLAGGFTAEHGDRHGGFVEMWTTAPDDRPRTRIETGTVNSRVSHVTRLGNGSLVVSARAWYPEAVRDTTELGQDGLDPRFGDGYVKYTRHVSARTLISAHALVGYDDVDFVERGGAERVDVDARTGYAWLRWVRAGSAGLVHEATLSLGRWTAFRAGLSEPEDEVLAVEDDRTVNFVGLRDDLTWRPSDSRLFRAGFEARTLEADYRYSVGDPAAPVRTTIDRSGTSLAAWATYRAALSERVAGEIGFRWDGQTYTDDDQTSPRAHLVWRASARDRVRASVGRFFQSHRIHELRVEDGETTFRSAELSEQADLTWQHRFDGGMRLRVDAYARRLSRIQPRYENLFNPIELFPETEADRALVAPERAELRGIEVLVQGAADEPLRWWASYAAATADDIVEGRAVPRSWDQTHAAKFLVAYRWRPGWAVSLSGSYHTGWPTTPATAEAVVLPDGSTGYEIVIGARNSIRFPTYARFDLKAVRSFAVGRGTVRIEAEVLNLADRANPCCVDEITLAPDGSGGFEARPYLVAWLGITPSLRVVWEF